MLRRIVGSFIVLAVVTFVVSCASFQRKPAGTKQAMVLETLPVPALSGLKIRGGYSPEYAGTPLKACVLYLQGLGDSVLNHGPFFDYLNASGYRVVFFDYMGQGGSEGSMNDTRILVSAKSEKKFEIETLADFAWEKWGCPQQEKKFVIGWSTGGLAGYRMAYEKKAAAVALIAPGLYPKKMIGEAAGGNWGKMILGKETITVRTLTRRGPLNNAIEVHLDPVKPNTPAVIPKFVVNLLWTAHQSHSWWIPRDVDGIVFLSGDEDTYVDSDKNRIVLQDKAGHFSLVKYDGALHELDNELPEVINDVYPRVVAFFDGALKRR